MFNISEKLKNKELNKVAINLSYNMAYQILTFLYPLLVTPIVSRVFGAELLGVYAYTYSIAYYFSLFVQLGISTYGNRLIASIRTQPEKLNITFSSLYFIQFVCGCGVLVLYCLYSVISQQYQVQSLLQGILILAAMVDITWLFAGLEFFKPLVLRNTLIKIFSLICICVFIRSPDDINLYIIIINTAVFIGQLTTWPRAFKYVRWSKFSKDDLIIHLPDTIKLFLPVLSINAYALIDKAMLGFFRPMEEVGFYENSEKLVKMPYFLSGAVTAVLLPRASYLISQGKSTENNRYVIKTMEWTLILALPMAVGLSSIAPGLIPWYLGEDFLVCAKYITLLSPLIICMTVSGILRMQYFIPNKQDRIYTSSVVGAAIINLMINMILVKPFGVQGVIAGTVISEAAAMCYLLVKSYKELRFSQIYSALFCSILSLFIMRETIHFLMESLSVSPMSTLIETVGGGSIYLISYFILGYLVRIIRNKC